MSEIEITCYTETSFQLQKICLMAQEQGVVALDTEFVWERTFFPKLGIVQLALPDGFSTIIDTIKIDDLSALGEILENDKIVKILHDSTQDLTILYNATGKLPKNIFDSQRAAGFAGLSSVISLANLLHESVNVDLAKTETRTNWLKRPLSNKQIEYALDDVRYLIKTREFILNSVKSATVLRWLEMEMKDLEKESLYHQVECSKVFLKIKGRNRLKSKQLALLRSLAEWREHEARRRNIPREHVVSNRQLLAIARLPLVSKEKLMSEQEIYDKNLANNIDAIISVCNKKIEPKTYPVQIKRLSKRANIKVKKTADIVLTKIKERSAAAGIDPALVFSRSKVETLLRSTRKIGDFGWRDEIIGDVIRDAK